jgi:hypothetical protein
MKYTDPSLEIIIFNTEDIICESPGNGVVVGGNGGSGSGGIIPSENDEGPNW